MKEIGDGGHRMKGTGLYVEHVATASRRLEETLRELQSGDPLAPVTVVTPSAYAVLFLRRHLGKQGLVNVRFMVLPRLAELLGASALAGQHRRPLTPLLEAAAIRGVAADSTVTSSAIRRHPKFHASLRSTFRELRYASADALGQLEARGGLRGEVIRLYLSFQERTSGYYDREALALSAAEAVQTGSATGLHDLGPIVFYLVHDLTPGETRLVEALASAWTCSVLLGITGEPDADARIRSLAGRLEPSLGTAQEGNIPPDETDSRLLVASDGREEIRWIARSIATDAYKGVPFHRMAVLYRHRDPYASLLNEELTLAGIPVSGPSPTSLAGTAVGRTLSGLVGLADGELSRDELIGWLTSCPVKSPSGGGQHFQPSQWDVLSRNAGIVRGIDQWRERLERYAQQMERLSESAREDLSEAAATRMAEAGTESRALAAFVEELYGRLQPPADGQPWKEFVAWVLGLMDAYLDNTTGALPEDEESNLDSVRSGLGEMEGLDDVEPGTALATFRIALDELLSAPATRQSRFGEGVFVGPLGTSIGLRFDRIYVVGMAEGVFPPRHSDDPLVPDRERRGAGGAAAGLPLRIDRATQERYTYLAALASAPARVLSFARGDPGAQRAQHPSRWFLEEAGRLHGAPVFATSLASLRAEPWLVAIASSEDGLRGVQNMGPADLHEYDLHSLWRWRTSGQQIQSHHLAKSENPLGRAIDMERHRGGNGLTEWDGDLSGIAAQVRRLRLTERTALSATGLQTWATCPFRYFLSSVLGIAALEEPEDVNVISPMERGSLIHSILEQFVSQVQETGGVPGPGEPWSNEHQRLLINIAGDAFRDAEARGVTGKRLLWELVRKEIEADLRAFLEEDNRIRREYVVSPRHVELAFGIARGSGANDGAAPPAEWSVPGLGVLRFRGMIDRLDVDPSGNMAVVLDYKTGRTTGYEGLKSDPVDRGKLVQLPIYGLAARQLLGSDSKVQAAYWFITARGGFLMRPPKPVPLEDVEERFGETLAVLAEGIQAGFFPAVPGVDIGAPKENCRFCDFDKLCPIRREVYWERKQRDPRLARYVGLATGASPQEGP